MPTVTVPLRERGELADAGGVLDRAQAARRMLREGAPRVSWHHHGVRRGRIGRCRAFVQAENLLGNRRLGDAQGLRGGREGAEFERRAEAADLVQR